MESLLIAKNIITSVLAIIVLVIFGANTGIMPFDSFWLFVGFAIAWKILQSIISFIIDIIYFNIFK